LPRANTSGRRAFRARAAPERGGTGLAKDEGSRTRPLEVPSVTPRSFFALAALTLMGLAAPALAAPIVITDPYTGSNAPGGGGDASDTIGVYKKFDIDRLIVQSVTLSEVRIRIQTNYNGGDLTLAPINLGGLPTLHVGDLLFGVHEGGSLHWRYGVALRAHDGFDAGDLYEIHGARTSTDYLPGVPFSWYRELTAVRMSPTGVDFTHHGAGTVTTSSLGNAAVAIDLAFAPLGGFLADYAEYGLDVHFAVATCANDVLDGRLEGILLPAPASLGLLGAGLIAALGAAGCRRGRAR
jgi:hypothetical protein